MVKSSTPEWTLTGKWAISRDAYNWILNRKSGKRWRAESYYRTPKLLLESLHRKILRIESPNPSLVEHIEGCFDTAQDAADLFKEHIAMELCPDCRKKLAAGSTSLRGVDYAS